MLKIVCICLLLAVVTSTNNVMLVTEYNYDKEPSTNIFRQNCVNYDDNDDENTNNIINSYDFCELGNIIHKNGLISTELLSVKKISSYIQSLIAKPTSILIYSSEPSLMYEMSNHFVSSKVNSTMFLYPSEFPMYFQQELIIMLISCNEIDEFPFNSLKDYNDNIIFATLIPYCYERLIELSANNLNHYSILWFDDNNDDKKSTTSSELMKLLFTATNNSSLTVYNNYSNNWVKANTLFKRNNNNIKNIKDADICHNKRFDEGEIDIDCGGVCDKKCDLHYNCTKDEDCESGFCLTPRMLIVVNTSGYFDYINTCLQDIPLPKLEIRQQKLTTGSKCAIIVFTILPILEGLILIFLQLKYKDHAIIKRSGNLSDSTIVLGLIILNIGTATYFYSEKGHPMLGFIYIFCEYIGNCLTLQGLFFKVYRIHRIFNANRLQRVVLSKKKMVIAFIGFYVLLFVILAIDMGIHGEFIKIKDMRMTYEPPLYENYEWVSTPLQVISRRYEMSKSQFNDIFQTIVLLFWYFVNCYYTFRIRNIQYRAFDESREICHSLFILFFMSLIKFYVRNGSDDINYVGVFIPSIKGIASIIIMCELHVPKFGRLYRAVKEDDSDVTNKTYCPRCGCKILLSSIPLPKKSITNGISTCGNGGNGGIGGDSTPLPTNWGKMSNCESPNMDKRKSVPSECSTPMI